MCDAMGNVGRDGLRASSRNGAKLGQSLMSITTGVRLRKGHIAPEHLEPQDGRGLECERLEPVLVHRGPLPANRPPSRTS